ncbi:MAG: PUA domain-containing protein, partial [Bacteroidota bacterium]
GAVRALRQRGASLLPSGVVAVDGDIRPGDPVEIADADGGVVARGIVRYSAAELARVLGRHSAEVEAVLGHAGSTTVVHRDDLVLTDPPDPDPDA